MIMGCQEPELRQSYLDTVTVHVVVHGSAARPGLHAGVPEGEKYLNVTGMLRGLIITHSSTAWGSICYGDC